MAAVGETFGNLSRWPAEEVERAKEGRPRCLVTIEVPDHPALRFGRDGKIHPEILDAYWRCGFYVFEGVLGAAELADLDADLKNILDRLPAERGAALETKITLPGDGQRG